MAGSFSTSCEAKITLKIQQLNVAAHICALFYVTIKICNYDVIFGRYLFQELGIQLDFQNDFIVWQDINLPVTPMDCKMRTHFTIQDSKNVRNVTNRRKKFIDATYKKANLKKIVNNLKYLSNDKRSLILKLLRKHEEMFDGTLGNNIGSEYKIELLEGAKPDHTKPFPISKIHKQTLRTEVNR